MPHLTSLQSQSIFNQFLSKDSSFFKTASIISNHLVKLSQEHKLNNSDLFLAISGSISQTHSNNDASNFIKLSNDNTLLSNHLIELSQSYRSNFCKFASDNGMDTVTIESILSEAEQFCKQALEKVSDDPYSTLDDESPSLGSQAWNGSSTMGNVGGIAGGVAGTMMGGPIGGLAGSALGYGAGRLGVKGSSMVAVPPLGAAYLGAKGIQGAGHAIGNVADKTLGISPEQSAQSHWSPSGIAGGIGGGILSYMLASKLGLSGIPAASLALLGAYGGYKSLPGFVDKMQNSNFFGGGNSTPQELQPRMSDLQYNPVPSSVNTMMGGTYGG